MTAPSATSVDRKYDLVGRTQVFGNDNPANGWVPVCEHVLGVEWAPVPTGKDRGRPRETTGRAVSLVLG
jgi:hypothetical protein